MATVTTTPPPAADGLGTTPLGWLLGGLLATSLAAWTLLLGRQALALDAGGWLVAAVLAPAAVLAWVARAGQRGGLALMGLAAATVALSDATLPSARDGAVDAQSMAKLALWLLGLLLLAWRGHAAKAAWRHAPSAGMAAFVLWCALGAPFSATPAYTAAAACALAGLWVLGSTCAQALTTRQALLALVTGLMLPLLLSLALLPMVPGLMLVPMEGGRVLRLGGVFGSANGLGRAAALCLLLALLAWPLRRHRLEALLLLAAMVTGTVALVMSDSRGATAALGLALAVTVALHRPIWLLIGLPLAAALALLPLTVPAVLDVALAGLLRTDRLSELTTLTGRTAIWAAAADLFMQSPWFGHGFGSTREVLPAAFQAAYGWTTTSAHNLWLQVAVTTGAVGLLLVLGLQAAWLREAWLRPQPVREAVLVFVAAVGLLEASAFGPGVNLLGFVTCWALALGLRTRDA